MDKDSYNEIDIKQIMEKFSSLTNEDKIQYISYLEQAFKKRNFKKTDGNSRLLVSEMKVRYFFLKKKQKNIDMN